jgi:hypothetical protein
MIFKIKALTKPPGAPPDSPTRWVPSNQHMRYFPGTLWSPSFHSQKYKEYIRSAGFKPEPDRFHLIRHQVLEKDFKRVPSREHIQDPDHCQTSCQFNDRRTSVPESVLHLRRIRPKVFCFSRNPVTMYSVHLPQYNMGADPITNSATVRQGSRHSNHGGK